VILALRELVGFISLLICFLGPFTHLLDRHMASTTPATSYRINGFDSKEGLRRTPNARFTWPGCDLETTHTRSRVIGVCASYRPIFLAATAFSYLLF